jgi:hypothetical protein
MAQRNVYKSQLPGFRASDIQLSFANYRAQADVAGEIIKRIDTVSDFALKKVNEQKVEEGTKYGVENAPSLSQVLETDAEDRKELFKDNKTIFNKAARDAQFGFVINEMAIAAHRDFANAEIEANENQQSQALYLKTLSNIKDEYVKVVSSINPDLAVELDAKLATKANSYYTSYIDKKIKESATQTKVLAMGFVTQELNDLEKIFSETNNYIDDKTGDQVYVNIENRILAKRKNLNNFIAKQKFTVAEATTILNNFDKAAERIKTDYVVNFVSKYAQGRTGGYNLYLKMSAAEPKLISDKKKKEGLATNDDINYFNEAATVEEILLTSDTNVKGSILKSLKASLDDKEGVIKSSDDAINLEYDKIYKQASIDFIDAYESRDTAKMNEALGVIRVAKPEKYESYAKGITGFDLSTNPSTISTPGLKDEIQLKINLGEITDFSDILKYNGAGFETLDGQKFILSPKDTNTLLGDFKTLQDKDMQDGIKLAKELLLEGVEPQILRLSTKVQDLEKLKKYNMVVADLVRAKRSGQRIDIDSFVKKTVDDANKKIDDEKKKKAIEGLSEYMSFSELTYTNAAGKEIQLPPLDENLTNLGAMQYHAFFTYYKNNIKLTKDITAFNQGIWDTDGRMKAFEQARRFFKNYGK